MIENGTFTKSIKEIEQCEIFRIAKESKLNIKEGADDNEITLWFLIR